MFARLDPKQLERVRKLLRARFTVPNELIVRKGERGDAVFFIASGAADVILPDRRIPPGTGDFFGEMAMITGEPRQADVRFQTCCRLLVLRKTDFDRFMRANPNVRGKIKEVAERRLMENKPEAAAATQGAKRSTSDRSWRNYRVPPTPAIECTPPVHRTNREGALVVEGGRIRRELRSSHKSG